MPILLPFSSDIPLIWFEEPPKVVPEDVLVLGIAPPADPPAGDRPADAPAPVVVAAALTGPDLPPAATGRDTAQNAAPIIAADPAPIEPPAGPSAAPAQAPAIVAAEPNPPEAASPPVAAAEPETALPLAPSFDVPPEDAFPTLADLDAILAANAGAPPEPSAEERAEVIALLGLDPAIADDPLRYAETLANLPEPDADQALEQWMRDYDVGALSPEVPDPAGDWQIG